jgi:hypothetical protein
VLEGCSLRVEWQRANKEESAKGLGAAADGGPEGDLNVFTLPHATHRATLAGIGTTGSLVAAVAAIATLTTGLVAFDAWPTPHRSSPQTLEIRPGVSVGARTPLLAPAFGVGRAGTLPLTTLPPVIAGSVGAAGPTTPTTSKVFPGGGTGRPGTSTGSSKPVSSTSGAASAGTSSPARPAPIAAVANVPKQIASAASGTGHGAATTVGAVTDNLGAGASNISPQLGVNVEVGGEAIQAAVVKVADGVAGLLTGVGGQ